jgi:tetrahydromethanopterin S-methyltransferase subunit H
MSIEEFSGLLWRILDDYEARGRDPQRVMEMIAYQVSEAAESDRTLSGPIEQIRTTVNVWERGDRTDLDALETIAVLARQM